MQGPKTVDEKRAWVSLASMAIVLWAVFFCSVNLRVPSQPVLGFDARWGLGGYYLICCLFIALGSHFGDKYGHRNFYLWGISLFSLGLILCIFASRPFFLLSGSFFQAMGAGFVLPVTLALIRSIFSNTQQQKAISMWGIAVSLGAGLGLIYRVFFDEQISGQALFGFALFLIVFAGLAALFAMPESSSRQKSPKTDRLGLILLFIALGTVSLVLL